jgi:hypothetical protein
MHPSSPGFPTRGHLLWQMICLAPLWAISEDKLIPRFTLSYHNTVHSSWPKEKNGHVSPVRKVLRGVAPRLFQSISKDRQQLERPALVDRLGRLRHRAPAPRPPRAEQRPETVGPLPRARARLGRAGLNGLPGRAHRSGVGGEPACPVRVPSRTQAGLLSPRGQAPRDYPGESSGPSGVAPPRRGPGGMGDRRAVPLKA